MYIIVVKLIGFFDGNYYLLCFGVYCPAAVLLDLDRSLLSAAGVLPRTKKGSRNRPFSLYMLVADQAALTSVRKRLIS